jgi:hypothetical protein
MQLLFTVYDSKAETFMPPFFVPSKGLAIRAFEDCVNSKEHHFGQHPADYTLFALGEFDTNTAHFVNMEKISIGNGVEFVNLLKPEHNLDAQSSRSTDQDG